MYKSESLKERFTDYDRVEMYGKTLWVPRPVVLPAIDWVERPDIVERVLAAWMPLDGRPPMNVRLYGAPGVGKNAVVYYIARLLQKDLYILNGNDDKRVEDVVCSGTLDERNRVAYVASPILAGALRGGIVFFDEIGKAPAAALDPLASLLDDRRTIRSDLAGIEVRAHPDFLFCAALNEAEELGLGLPPFLEERTLPAIHVTYPDRTTLAKILKCQLPTAADVWFRVFLREYKEVELSPRRAFELLSFAYRLAVRSDKPAPSADEAAAFLHGAEADVLKPADRPAAAKTSERPQGEEPDAVAGRFRSKGKKDDYLQ